jgi:hypothetical protein
VEWYILISLALMPFVYGPDPARGLIRTREQSRNMDCERVGVDQGSERYPGVIVPTRPRGDFVQRSVVVCKERLMPPGSRTAQDDAILLSLQGLVDDLATAAGALRPDLADRTWLVETHYPSGQVAAKIAFATKNALLLQGLRVSDRTPILGVGDIDVITRMEPELAYAAACQRYAASGSLGGDDALLAIVNLDPRETILHAGLCVDGAWEWLR